MGNILASVINFATNTGRFTYGALGNVGLSGSGQSAVLLIIFGAFVLAIIGFWLGRSRILISILSIFAGYFIESNFDFISNLKSSGLPAYMIQLGVFIVAFLISFFIMNRSVLKSRITVRDASIISVIILSVINAGLLASVVISYFPAGSEIIPAQLSSFLGTKTARFAWAAVALIAMFFSKGKREVSSSIRIK